MSKRRKNETDDQFIRRIDRTFRKKIKDGGPTYAEVQRAISIKLRRKGNAKVLVQICADRRIRI